jgi:hypothetical protein
VKEKDTELARLKRENAKLRRENEYLSHRIEKLSPKEAKNITQERELFLSSADVDKYKGYFPYLIGRFKLSFVYRIYDRIFFALRKLLLASKIWRYLPVAAGVILQTILALGSVVVLLPVSVTAALVFFAFSLMLYREGMPGCFLFTAVAMIFYFVISIRFGTDIMPGTLTSVGESLAL